VASKYQGLSSGLIFPSNSLVIFVRSALSAATATLYRRDYGA
jgi:hypothetical protein